jgi:hypothetical protein
MPADSGLPRPPAHRHGTACSMDAGRPRVAFFDAHLTGHSGTTPDSRLRPAGTGRRPGYARFLITKVTNVRRVVGSVPVTSQQPSVGKSTPLG